MFEHEFEVYKMDGYDEPIYEIEYRGKIIGHGKTKKETYEMIEKYSQNENIDNYSVIELNFEQMDELVVGGRQMKINGENMYEFGESYDDWRTADNSLSDGKIEYLIEIGAIIEDEDEDDLGCHKTQLHDGGESSDQIITGYS